jgi:hypothetical protein
MNSSNSTTPRRLLTIVSLIVALVMEPVCMLLDAANYNGNFPPSRFSLLMVLALLAGVTALAAGRSRWRWLLLLLILPYIYYLLDEMDIIGSIGWALKHHQW